MMKLLINIVNGMISTLISSKSISLFIHVFFEQMFIERLLCSRYCPALGYRWTRQAWSS